MSEIGEPKELMMGSMNHNGDYLIEGGLKLIVLNFGNKYFDMGFGRNHNYSIQALVRQNTLQIHFFGFENQAIQMHLELHILPVHCIRFEHQFHLFQMIGLESHTIAFFQILPQYLQYFMILLAGCLCWNFHKNFLHFHSLGELLEYFVQGLLAMVECLWFEC